MNLKNAVMNKLFMEFLTNHTNRSKHQTQFLFELVDGNYSKLLKLETKIKKNFVFYCPGDKVEVCRILNMK